MPTEVLFDFKKASAFIEEEILRNRYKGHPESIYEPINYLMAFGGKRMRPLLVLLGCYLYDDDFYKAKDAALAVEVFHNFTLMHDDIMDNAPLRRGLPTVHEKWGISRGILSGDVMLIKSYELMFAVPPALLPKTLALFGHCAAQVCEGQQIDMDFESLQNVSEEGYLGMIKLKTAVLLGFSLEIGALIGGADDAQAAILREYGIKMGIGFQLKDDILDVYGDAKDFGKQVGGDIIANKKTYLLIKAQELAQGAMAEKLAFWIGLNDFDKDEKINAVTEIYDALGVKAHAEALMANYFADAYALLQNIATTTDKKEALKIFSQSIIDRIK